MEVKSVVAKRFNRQNLFQVACFDLRERFHYLVLLSFVCVRNLNELDWDLGARRCSVLCTVYCKFTLRVPVCIVYSSSKLRARVDNARPPLATNS